MSNSYFNCRCNCTGLAIIASVLLGIVAAVLRFTAVITVTPAFLWVVFGIAVVALGLTLLVAAFGGAVVRRCLYSALPALLTGILGAILIAVVLLAIEFVATSIIGAILTGLLIAFFALVLTVTACVIKCIASYGEE